MSRLAVFILLILSVVCFTSRAVSISSYSDDEISEFKEWTIKYNKRYSSTEEFAVRLGNYFANKAEIFRLNQVAKKSHADTVFGINKFADLTGLEFKAQYRSINGFDSTIPKNAKVHPKVEGPIPAAFDWRTHAPLNNWPVKNQGQCGSCWAFSTIANIESVHGLSTGTLVSLSEQNIVDCSKNCIIYDGQQSCNAGCDGGLQPAAFEYVISNKGVDTEVSYPYTAMDGTCDFKSSNVGATISNWAFVTTTKNETEVAAFVATKNPVSIAADAAEWQFYVGGVFSIPCGQTLDHGIAIVGYASKKTLLGSKDYWIVRNSWGQDWGENGYIYLEKGVNKCGVVDYVSSSSL